MNRLIVNHLDKHFPRQRGNRSALAATISLFSQSKRERVRALSDISFQLGDGEVLGLIGRNGAGKTTLLKTIAGIYQPNAGNIKNSKEIGGLSGGSEHGGTAALQLADPCSDMVAGGI